MTPDGIARDPLDVVREQFHYLGVVSAVANAVGNGTLVGRKGVSAHIE